LPTSAHVQQMSKDSRDRNWGTFWGTAALPNYRYPSFMSLSELAIRAAKPQAKPYKVYDEKGLFLLVRPSGARLWRFKYSHGGVEKLLALGPSGDSTQARPRQARLGAQSRCRRHRPGRQTQSRTLCAARHIRCSRRGVA